MAQNRILPYQITTGSFEDLLAAIPFEQRSVTVYGKTHPQPRLTKWYGPVAYQYSNLTWEPCGLPPLVEAIRQEIEALSGERFNCVLCNLYRDGKDTVGWHSDDEPLFGPDPVVASVSYGACREFRLRQKKDHEAVTKLRLKDRTLIVMCKGIQQNYQHSLPRDKSTEPRINLTFRLVGP